MMYDATDYLAQREAFEEQYLDEYDAYLDSLEDTMTDEQYVECMIAAGWIDGGDVDEDYQSYLVQERHFGMRDILSYTKWKPLFDRLHILNAEYKAFEAKHGIPGVYDIPEAETLLDEMNDIEQQIF